MNNPLKIIVAHPGKQHSYRLANALKKEGILFKYITTVYNKENSFFIRILSFFLKKENVTRANKRSNAFLKDSEVIQFNEVLGLLLLFLQRVDKSKKISFWLDQKIKRQFGRKVANYAIKNKVDGVICFDTNAEECFRILKEKDPSIKRILDHSAVPRNYLNSLFKRYHKSSYKFYDTIKDTKYLINQAHSEKYVEEIRQADFHIVASSFTQKGLIFTCISDEKVLNIPYGVSNFFTTVKEKKYDKKKKLKFLFIGEFSQKKGIEQFLEVAIKLGHLAEFNIVGKPKDSCNELFDPYKNSVNFLGYVLPEKLKEIYENNDIFVFPSMGDGFGLVLLEAMSMGLPIIASENSGASDVVSKGENGFLFEAGNTTELEERVLWFNLNRDKIHDMSKNAKETALNYTWENYEKKLVTGLKEKFFKL